MSPKFLFTFVAAITFSGSALAFHCPADMKKIDEALANNPAISAAKLAEVKHLRALGEEQHNNGNHADAVTMLDEALKILGIE